MLVILRGQTVKTDRMQNLLFFLLVQSFYNSEDQQECGMFLCALFCL